MTKYHKIAHITALLIKSKHHIRCTFNEFSVQEKRFNIPIVQ